jgi:hypothetical protein
MLLVHVRSPRRDPIQSHNLAHIILDETWMPAVRNHKQVDRLENISPGVITAGCDKRDGEVSDRLPDHSFDGDTILIGVPRVNC